MPHFRIKDRTDHIVIAKILNYLPQNLLHNEKKEAQIVKQKLNLRQTYKVETLMQAFVVFFFRKDQSSFIEFREDYY